MKIQHNTGVTQVIVEGKRGSSGLCGCWSLVFKPLSVIFKPLFKNAFHFLNLRTPFTKIRSTFPIFQATCRKIFKTVAPTYSKRCKEKNRALTLSRTHNKNKEAPPPKKGNHGTSTYHLLSGFRSILILTSFRSKPDKEQHCQNHDDRCKQDTGRIKQFYKVAKHDSDNTEVGITECGSLES